MDQRATAQDSCITGTRQITDGGPSATDCPMKALIDRAPCPCFWSEAAPGGAIPSKVCSMAIALAFVLHTIRLLDPRPLGGGQLTARTISQAAAELARIGYSPPVRAQLRVAASTIFDLVVTHDVCPYP